MTDNKIIMTRALRNGGGSQICVETFLQISLQIPLQRK
jgi:hypothetical protein